jgi:hypothetical protein
MRYADESYNGTWGQEERVCQQVAVAFTLFGPTGGVTDTVLVRWPERTKQNA